MPSSLNGTGVTFNDGTTLQSGNIPAANLGSGTANASTVLRGDRTFGAPPAPTTAQVLTAYAGAAYGDVGTYVLGWRTGSNITEGATFAGSTIFPSGFESGNAGPVGANGRWTAVGTRGGTAVSGTWRAMGRVATGLTGNTATLYLRIS